MDWCRSSRNCLSMSWRRRALTFVLSLFVAGALLVPPASGNQCKSGLAPHFQRLSLEHGLSQSVVTAITEDQQGYLWFGTQEGLNRYDGTAFQVLRRGESQTGNALLDNQINVLAHGQNGTVWIGTPRGLAARNADNSSLYRPAIAEPWQNAHILSLITDGSNRVWVGTTRGLYVFDPKVDTTTVWVGDGGKRLADEHIRALAIDDQHVLWLATAKGIHRINLANGEWFEGVLLPEANVSAMALRDNQRIIASSQFGLFESAIGADARFEKWSLPLPSSKVQAMLEDHDQRLWIATDNGVLIVEEDDVCVLTRDATNSASLSASDVMSLHIDSQGIIWLGTYAGGVSFWDTRNARFRQHLAPWRLPKTVHSNTVLAVLRDSHNDLWFGLAGSGLVRKRGRELTHFPLPGIDNNGLSATVTALLEDKDGALWIGVFGEGLLRLDPSRRQAHQFLPQADDINTLSNPYIRTLYEDHSGQLWVGTEAGLDRLIEETPERYRFQRFGAMLPLPYQTISTEVVGITEDYSGQLWIGGQGGVVRIATDREQMTLYQHEKNNPSSLSSTAVTAIRLSSNGDIWVGTQEGFNIFRRSLQGDYLIARHSRVNNLPMGSVYGILPGSDGDVWLATATGLLRQNSEKNYLVQYRASNGLPTDEFNQGAAFLSADGELLFGSINGAVSFHPRRMAPPRTNAPVVLTGIRQYDQALPLPIGSSERAAIAVDADVRVLSFDYSVLDYSESSRNQLRYRVAGLHDQWINLVRSNTVTLSGLEPGRYRLEVQGAPAKGVWSAQTHLTDITVRSPFWSVHMSYGVAIASIVVLGGMLWLSYWRINRHALRKAREQASTALQQTTMLEQQSETLLRSQQLQIDAMHQQEQELTELRQRLLDAQQHDALTGLPSRRFALPLFTELTLTSRQRGLLLVDIDGLSVLNELHGLLGGDRILMQFAELLTAACRDDDQVLRWHGGTFLLVCHVESINEVKMLCERIKARVLQHAFMLSDRKTVDLTCSIGFATWPLCMNDSEPGDWQNSITMAEEALFLAKHFGRNCWFGFYVEEGGSLTARMQTQRQMIREGVEQEWLSIASSITLPVDFLSIWPRR